jgi:hypothetical protein
VWGVTLRVVSVAGAAGFAEIALDYSIASPLAVACARVSYLFLLQFEFQVRAKYTRQACITGDDEGRKNEGDAVQAVFRVAPCARATL